VSTLSSANFTDGNILKQNAPTGPICLVFGTAALCDALVRSAVYKSSYLLTYLLTYIFYECPCI